MTARWYTSLSAKQMIASLVILLLPVLALATFSHLSAREALTRQAVERSASQVHLQAESIVSSLQQALGDALYLAALPDMRMLQQQFEPDAIARWRADLAADFHVMLSVRPMYRAIRFINDDGREEVVVESDGIEIRTASTLLDRSAAQYFQAAIDLPPGGVYVSSLARDPSHDNAAPPLIHYTLRPAQGAGVISIELYAGWLLRNLPAGSPGEVWAIMDQDGRYLVYPDTLAPSWYTDDLTPMLRRQRGSIETGDSVYVFDTLYPTSGDVAHYWVLYRETPKAALYADLTSFYLAAVGITLMGIGLAVLLAFLLSHLFLAPILHLKQMVEDFGRDGAAPPIPDHVAADEIGALTQAFYGMAAELERKRQFEHRLIERLIRAQEEERKLVAYDLHDGLIQQMVGARFYLSQCQAQGQIPGLQQGCEALTQAIIEGRRIIEGLRPAVLDDLGLQAALHELARSQAEAAGWELTLDLHPLPEEPETSVAVTLFRVTQEALNNIRKHAAAQRVCVSLHNGDGITITVTDDGRGFDLPALAADGHGLGVTTMHERAALLGGRCWIDSAPGAGTRITVWVPVTLTALTLTDPVPA